MRYFFFLLIFLLGCTFICTLAKEDLPGKNLFLTSKGKYGSCNFCHKNGGSAGRWDFEYEEISKDEGRIIPSLKGIGKKKSIEQIERSITYMKKMFGFKLTEEEITQIAEYVATL